MIRKEDQYQGQAAATTGESLQTRILGLAPNSRA